jgi:hypothetical protein
MDLIALFDHFELSQITEVIYTNGQIYLQFSWTLSMMQFREYIKIIREQNPSEIDIHYDKFLIILNK